jgi:hypothetical protein
MKKTTYSLILSILLFSGCVQDMANSLTKSLNNYFLNVDNNSSLIIVGSKNITQGKPKSIELWFENIKTKEKHLISLEYTNFAMGKIPAGTYEFTSWNYKKCLTDAIYLNGKHKKLETVGDCQMYDKYNVHTIGDYTSTLKLKTGNRFEIKKGEAIYLGNFTVVFSGKKTTSYNYEGKHVIIRVLDLVLSDNIKEDVAITRLRFDFPHKVINKSNVINTKQWSQGFRGLFGGHSIYPVDMKTGESI